MRLPSLRSFRFGAALAAALLSFAAASGPAGASGPAPCASAPAAKVAAAPLPLVRCGVGFVANRGRWDADVVARAGLPGYGLSVTRSGAALATGDGDRIAIDFAEAPVAELRGERRGRVNLLVGRDADAFTTGLRHYDAVVQRGAAEGADVEWSLGPSGARFDVRVAPGADEGAFALTVRGARGLAVDADGALTARTSQGTLRLAAPFAWQEAATAAIPVAAAWRLVGDDVAAFRVTGRDPSLPLVIDPTLTWTTSIGGASIENVTFGGRSMAAGPAGTVYVAGSASSLDFPASNGAYQTSRAGGSDAFVVKLDADGAVVFATLVGGTRSVGNFTEDALDGVAVDATGAAYLTGIASDGFPVTGGAFDGVYAGPSEGFAAKLAADGASLVYATFLGGDGIDRGTTIAVEPTTGVAYVGGFTLSADFPRVGSIKATTDTAFNDAFVVKLAADGRSAAYSTVFGGDQGTDPPAHLVIGSQGALYVAGRSTSASLPTTVGVVQPSAGEAPVSDPYVGKLLPSGGGFEFLTYLGNSKNDLEQIDGMALDSAGRLVIAGESPAAAGFPVTTPGAAQPSRAGGDELFVLRLAADASAIEFATYLGGSAAEDTWPCGTIALDAADAIYVCGQTSSADFPVAGGPGETLSGPTDAFAAKLSKDGDDLVWSTFLGGSGHDNAGAILVDATDGVTVAGVTLSTDFGTRKVGPGGSLDVFVTRLAPDDGGGDAPRTLSIVVTKGKLTNSSVAGKDSFKAKGTFTFNAFSPDGQFNPVADDLAIAIGGTAPQVGGAAGEGWKTSARGKITWKTPKGAVPSAKLTLDPSKGTFTLAVKGADLGAAAVDPVVLDLSVGDDSGVVAAPWREKKPGVLVLP